MPLGEKTKAAWPTPLRAGTLKQQTMITRRSGHVVSGKLVLNQLKGSRWWQNHNCAWSKPEDIVMVLTSQSAYKFLICATNRKQTIFILYNEWKERNCQLLSLKVLFILTGFLPNDYIKMQVAPAACHFCIITMQKHRRVCGCDFDAMHAIRT